MTFATTFKKGDRVSLHSGPHVPRGSFIRGTFQRHEHDLRLAIVDLDGVGQTIVECVYLKHAPVDIIGPPLLDPPTSCPDCGSELTIDPEAVRVTPRGDMPPHYATVRVAACSGCEWIVELPKGVYR